MDHEVSKKSDHWTLAAWSRAVAPLLNHFSYLTWTTHSLKFLKHTPPPPPSNNFVIAWQLCLVLVCHYCLLSVPCAADMFISKLLICWSWTLPSAPTLNMLASCCLWLPPRHRGSFTLNLYKVQKRIVLFPTLYWYLAVWQGLWVRSRFHF